MPTRTPLEQSLMRQWPPQQWQNDHIMVAVSGGPDSVALLRALLAIRTAGRGRVFAAHFNHGLREVDSDADQAWVAALCRRLEVSLVSGEGDVGAIARDDGDGWEAAARRARYDFLQRAAANVGARYLLTGHTADDQVETILFRIFRGTGCAGLTGIPVARAFSDVTTLLRPLLGVWRRDIREYLTGLGQDYRVDATNTDPRFARNRIRHTVLPVLRDQFGDAVDQAIARLGEQAAELQDIVNTIVDPLTDRCVQTTVAAGSPRGACSRLTISIRELADQPPLIVSEVCRRAWQRAAWPQQNMSSRKWRELAALVSDAKTRPLTLPGNVQARVETGHIVLERHIAAANSTRPPTPAPH